MPHSLSLISIPSWGKLTEKPSAFPPDLHKTSHQLAGADAIDCAGLAGRVNYVDRGDPSAADWTADSFTRDSTWRDLSCAAIVPAGAKAIHLSLSFTATAATVMAGFRKKGNTQGYNCLLAVQQVANINNYLDGLVACNQDRVIQYFFQTATWSYIAVTVRGWLI